MRQPKVTSNSFHEADGHESEPREIYSNADVFEPNRYQDDHLDASRLQEDYRRRDHRHYGLGRRLCQGVHVAEASLYTVESRYNGRLKSSLLFHYIEVSGIKDNLLQ